MSNIFDFMKSLNDLSEKTKSLNILRSPLHNQMIEMAKFSNINLQPNSLAALMSISKIISDSSFQNSLINANQINNSLNFGIMPMAKLIQNSRIQKIGQTIAIPNSTLSAFSQLAAQQEKINESLFASLSSINSISLALSEVNKIKNLNIAFTSLSAEIAKLASINQTWDIIEDFEDLTTEAVTLSNQLIEEYNPTITEENSNEFKLFLNSVEEFYKKHKDAGIILLFVIDVILRFAGLHQYYDFIKDKPEPATKIEFKEIKNSQATILRNLDEIKNQLNEKNKISYTNKNCQIKLKPNSRSSVINNLPENYEIVVVKIQPTWFLINYFDPNDGLPQTGWINKKDIK